MQSTHTRTQKHSWTIISHHYWMWMITLMMMKWESRERRMIDCNNEKNLNLTDVFPLFLKHEIKNCNFVTLNLNNFINFTQNQLFYQKLTASHKFESFFILSRSSSQLVSTRDTISLSIISIIIPFLFIFTIHSLLTQLFVAFHSLTTKLYVNYTQKTIKNE